MAKKKRKRSPKQKANDKRLSRGLKPKNKLQNEKNLSQHEKDRREKPYLKDQLMKD